MTGAFSRNIGKLFSKLKLETDDLSFICNVLIWQTIACVFSLQISFLAVSPLHGFSRGVAGPEHSTAVCQLVQHGLGVHWCLCHWRSWTQVRYRIVSWKYWWSLNLAVWPQVRYITNIFLTGSSLMSWQHIFHWGEHIQCYLYTLCLVNANAS